MASPLASFPPSSQDAWWTKCRAIGAGLIGDVDEIEMSSTELSGFLIHQAVQRTFVEHLEWSLLMRYPHPGSRPDAAAGYTGRPSQLIMEALTPPFRTS